jgi:hypothetical protein
VNEKELIFYHFANFKQISRNTFKTDLSRVFVRLDGIIKNKIYVPYAVAISKYLDDSRLIIATPIEEAPTKEISLRISSVDYIENMIKGSSFYVQFSNIQTEGISLDIINSMGSNVFHKENLINQRSPQRININNLSSGVYFVKIYANKKVYVQRVFITNN